jgi:hypothetical protein
LHINSPSSVRLGIYLRKVGGWEIEVYLALGRQAGLTSFWIRTQALNCKCFTVYDWLLFSGVPTCTLDKHCTPQHFSQNFPTFTLNKCVHTTYNRWLWVRKRESSMDFSVPNVLAIWERVRAFLKYQPSYSTAILSTAAKFLLGLRF